MLRPRSLLLAGALATLAVIAGIIFATRVILAPSEPATSTSLAISDITLGALANPGEAATANPRLRQAGTYTTTDQLALRVTLAQTSAPATVTVRLTTATGQVEPLQPGTVTVNPGTATTCCWTIAKPGTYTWQLFHAGRIVASLPLKIKAAAPGTTKVSL